MRQFFASLNVFVPTFVLAYFLAATPVRMLVSAALLALHSSPQREILYAQSATYALVLLALVAFWWRVGLSPRQRKPEREARFRRGHTTLAIANSVLVAAILIPVLVSLSGRAYPPTLAWLTIAAYPIVTFGWAAGLFMVWSSRAPH